MIVSQKSRLGADRSIRHVGVKLIEQQWHNAAMEKLSRKLYTASQIRAIEQRVIYELGIPGYTLMSRAGQAAFEQCSAMLKPGATVLVLVGPGNNGGDGYVVARLLRQANYTVELLSLASDRAPQGDAAIAQQAWLAAGGRIEAFHGELPEAADLIIDAVLGTGLERPLTGDFLLAVQLINEHRAAVLAVDLPTGLHSETGMPMGAVVFADETVTYIGLKLGMFVGMGLDACGSVVLDDLDIPEYVFETVEPPVSRLLPDEAAHYLPVRRQTSHKGDFGHVVVLGGDRGMSGAARMCAEAALRVGSGLVTVATHLQHAALINLTRPELMTHAVETPGQVHAAFERATVIAMGPGMGTGPWSMGCFMQTIGLELPMVVDAGALTLLAQEPRRSDNWILTPHPGEAARLLDTTVAEIQSDRIRAAQELRLKFGGVAVLKGAGTVIAGPGGVYLSDAGNPGMSTGGMGDVLTGVIAGLLAQGLYAEVAACVAVMVHGRAGDQAAGHHPRGLLATDLMPFLRRLVNP